MQQATVNLLADMGVQPATLDVGPGAGDRIHRHHPADLDDHLAVGRRDHRERQHGHDQRHRHRLRRRRGRGRRGVHRRRLDLASGDHDVRRAASVTWSYTWSAAGNGPVTIESRATDDSGNIEKPGPGVTVTVSCPCGLFGANYTPSHDVDSDSSAYELGVKFQSSVPGWVAGVRFYKGAGNTGTHTGSLWTASGTLLATGTFTNETASGWQTLTFANPVQISANTTYVVATTIRTATTPATLDLFDWQLNTPPLVAPKSNYLIRPAGNGVYNPGGPGFPTAFVRGYEATAST